MADQLQMPDTVTAAQFFEELLPMGFAARQAEGETPPNTVVQYHVTGEGGGDWTLRFEDGALHVSPGRAEAPPVAFTLAEVHFREALLGRNGAALSLILPQGRPGRPQNAARVAALKGTMALELARDGADPFKLELRFNNAVNPRTTMKMKIADYLLLQEGKLNGQEAFMSGRLRVEGDLPFLMQVAALTQ